MNYPTGLAELAVGNIISGDEITGEIQNTDGGELIVIVYGTKEDSKWEIDGYRTEILGPRKDIAKFWCEPVGDNNWLLARGRPMDSSNHEDPFGEPVYHSENDDERTTLHAENDQRGI